MYLFDCSVRCCTWAFSRCGEWGYSSLQCMGFSLRWLLLWRLSSRAQAQQLWPTGLVATLREGSSQTRDQTGVPCVGKGILSHWTTALSSASDLTLNMVYLPTPNGKSRISPSWPWVLNWKGELSLPSIQSKRNLSQLEKEFQTSTNTKSTLGSKCF